jgi:hypothetical protein
MHEMKRSPKTEKANRDLNRLDLLLVDAIQLNLEMVFVLMKEVQME